MSKITIDKALEMIESGEVDSITYFRDKLQYYDYYKFLERYQLRQKIKQGFKIAIGGLHELPDFERGYRRYMAN